MMKRMILATALLLGGALTEYGINPGAGSIFAVSEKIPVKDSRAGSPPVRRVGIFRNGATATRSVMP